ncbi:hypothetical protein QT823_22475, partial [Xanthomonas citri pv. citri]
MLIVKVLVVTPHIGTTVTMIPEGTAVETKPVTVHVICGKSRCRRCDTRANRERRSKHDPV